MSDYLTQQEGRQQRYLRHEELYGNYRKGIIPLPDIQWHEDLGEIDFSVQRDKMHPKLHDSGFTILKKVDIERLFDEMDITNGLMYRKKQLYNRTQNEMTISAVWDHWLNGQKLIPPTIIIFDQQYINLLAPGGIPSTELQPVDGKHRLNVANYFGAETLPIIVLQRQLRSVMRLLGMA